MKIAVYSKWRKEPRTRGYMESFTLGISRHGITPEILPEHTKNPVDADIAVVWGIGKRLVVKKQLSEGRSFIVLENGYFGQREQWCSAGYNGLNGQADFRNVNSPGDRWERYGPGLSPWKGSAGDYVLVMGQVHNDKSVLPCQFAIWSSYVTKILIDNGNKVVFRKHPRDKTGFIPQGAEVLKRMSLLEEMRNAKWVVTYSSTAGVDAMIAGVPTVAMNTRSMVFNIAGHDLLSPGAPNREQWAKNLAYCQWSKDELESGEAWDHLKPGWL